MTRIFRMLMHLPAPVVKPSISVNRQCLPDISQSLQRFYYSLIHLMNTSSDEFKCWWCLMEHHCVCRLSFFKHTYICYSITVYILILCNLLVTSMLPSVKCCMVAVRVAQLYKTKHLCFLWIKMFLFWLFLQVFLGRILFCCENPDIQMGKWLWCGTR